MPLVSDNCSTRPEGSDNGAAMERPSRRGRAQQQAAGSRQGIEPAKAKKRLSGAQKDGRM
jgi:hypothetical protein